MPPNSAITLAERVRDVLFEAEATFDNPLTENELADRFEVSRTPIRDALRTLQMDGIIERKQRKGIYLRMPSTKEIEELYDLRAIIEGFAGTLATQKAKRSDLAELDRYAKAFTKSRAKNDSRATEQANISFHGKIVELAGSSLLCDVVDRFSIVRNAFKIARGLHVIESSVVTPYPHEHIVDLMRRGDDKGAGELLKAHILWGKEFLIEHLSEQDSK